jgi:hypothetical protein
MADDGTYGGMTIQQWIDAALKTYGAYKSSQPGKFQQIPEDPSQVAARARMLGFIDNSPTRDMLSGLIKQRLGSATGFQLPPGMNGYNPNPDGGGSAAPKYDLSKIFGGGNPAAPHANTGPGIATQAHLEGGGRPAKDVVGNDGGYFQGEFERGGGLGRLAETDQNRNVTAGANNPMNPLHDPSLPLAGMSYGSIPANSGFAQPKDPGGFFSWLQKEAAAHPGASKFIGAALTVAMGLSNPLLGFATKVGATAFNDWVARYNQQSAGSGAIPGSIANSAAAGKALGTGAP